MATAVQPDSIAKRYIPWISLGLSIAAILLATMWNVRGEGARRDDRIADSVVTPTQLIHYFVEQGTAAHDPLYHSAASTIVSLTRSRLAGYGLGDDAIEACMQMRERILSAKPVTNGIPNSGDLNAVDAAAQTLLRIMAH